MTQKTLLEQYAEELMLRAKPSSANKAGKKPHGACGLFKKEWSREDILLEKNKVDDLIWEFRGVQRLNRTTSPEHQADIVFRNHWRASTHDEVWMYMVETVGRAQEMNSDEDEMWRSYYENRLKICGPGDCHVWVYHTRRGGKARMSFACGKDLPEINSNRDIADDGERVYTCGGRRHYIVGGCYTRVPKEGASSGDCR
jgi:hypothetical protein